MTPRLVDKSREKLPKSGNESYKLRIKALYSSMDIWYNYYSSDNSNNSNNKYLTPLSLTKKFKQTYKIKTRPISKRINKEHQYNRHGIKYVKRVNRKPYPPQKQRTKSKLRESYP